MTSAIFCGSGFVAVLLYAAGIIGGAAMSSILGGLIITYFAGVMFVAPMEMEARYLALTDYLADAGKGYAREETPRAVRLRKCPTYTHYYGLAALSNRTRNV